MAIQPCRECGKDISTEAATCPYCGAAKAKSQNIGLWFVLGGGVLLLAFCSTQRAIQNVPVIGEGSGSSAVVADCAPSDFTVSKLNATEEYGYAKLTGILHNGCSRAVGVQLKWTVLNSDGTVAFSHDFWPASTTNIPPKSDYPFDTMNTAPHGRWTYSVVPISVDTW